jgi:hypothetical protein
MASVENGYPYECWYETKRSGVGHRLIEHPHGELKAVQARINRLLQRLALPRIFHGCYAGTSILSNARHHRKDSWFLTFDLANYYKTIRPAKVYQGLVAYHAAPDVARALTRLMTIKGRVPQGAPTSPIAAVLAMLRLADRLSKLAQSFGSTVTVFGDNVCLSGPRRLASQKNTILKIAVTEGFRVRREKTVITEPGQDKPLPGVIIRSGRVTLYDEDFTAISATVENCLSMGTSGLAKCACSRFNDKLQGRVHHYHWIDAERMKEHRQSCLKIRWPAYHKRSPCLGPHCHCEV